MNGTTAYSGAEIFDGYRRHARAALVVEDGRVAAILPESELESGVEKVEFDGGLIAPGFVDLQVNGGGGVMMNDDPSADAIRTICDAHARAGTTALLPTLITDVPEATRAAAAAAREALARGVPGMIGLHLEGPHLALARKGAHHPDLIRPMDEADCLELEALAGELPNLLLTVAPEAVSLEQISRLREAGAVVSLGHTDCNCDQALAAVRAGARCATHLFNAMSQLGSREPGLVGAALEAGELSAGLIADGFHVDPVTVRAALRAKRGPGFLFLVSDSMCVTGTDLDEFTLNGRRILRQGGRLTLEDGTLAGADLDLSAAVRFMAREIGLEEDEALRMASLYPARLLGEEGALGCLAPGARADFVRLDDDLGVAGVWSGGKEKA